MARRNSLDNSATLTLTPMIDVMTVLLAVFVVTTPMMTSGLDLDLPKAGHGSVSGDDHAIQLSVDNRGRYYMGKAEMTKSAIVKKMLAMKTENEKLTIMINGDQAASYGQVIELMGALKDAGFARVGLRTRIPD